jgi:hypothetical protein
MEINYQYYVPDALTSREIDPYPWNGRFVGLSNGFGPGGQLGEGEERKLAFS